MTDLRRARADVLAFSHAIEWPLATWQAEALRLQKRVTTIVAPRQSGKSRSLAVTALWAAFRRRDQHVLLVSAGESASRRLLSECARVAQRSPLLRGSVVDEFAQSLTLSNGSRLLSVPASERQIRGETVDCAIIDEAALVPDELLLDACLPTVAARPKAKVILASSPASPEGAFHDFARQGDDGSEHVETHHWTLDLVEWIEPAAVESAQQALAPAAFQREYLGEFADVGADERVIERQWIAEAGKREIAEQRHPVFAVDVARHGGDETVIVRIAGAHVRVVWAARGLQSVMPIAERIRALSEAESGPPCLFTIDADGIGWGVLDRCAQMGVRVAAFQGGTASRTPARYANTRAEAWWLTRECLRDGHVDLDPLDHELAVQLGRVTYSLDLQGRILVQSKKAMRSSPDRADALVMAIHAAAGQVRSEQVAKLVEQARTAPVDPLLEGTKSIEETDWHGTRPGSWKDRLDRDLPDWPAIR